MKKCILLIIISCTVAIVPAQQTKRFIFATNAGIGIDMSEPAVTPLTWQVLGYYAITPHFFRGIGTGVSLYDKILIPLFADAKLTLTKPRKFTPYIECGVGYSFASDKKAIGGFYLNPSMGIQYSIYENKKLFFAIGYESQKLQRLKIHHQPVLTTRFVEKLSHNVISIKIGFIFKGI